MIISPFEHQSSIKRDEASMLPVHPLLTSTGTPSMPQSSRYQVRLRSRNRSVQDGRISLSAFVLSNHEALKIINSKCDFFFLLTLKKQFS
jgi:hypothetical protein